MSTFAVVGAGMMGSALCLPLVDAGHDVRLVGTHLDDPIIGELRKSGVHPHLRIELPGAIRTYADAELGEAMLGVDAIAVGVSSAGVAWAGRRLAPFVSEGLPILMISKGLAPAGDTLRILPDVLRDELDPSMRDVVQPVAVAGPCIAGELAHRVATTAVFTGRDSTAVETLRRLVSTHYYHVRTSPDVVGVEVCAALKNAYALGVAIAWGLHERRGGSPGSVAMHNTESAVFAQAIVEMKRIAGLLGGNPESATWLPGAGDLYVTCNAGRTGRLGRLLGLGSSRDEAIAKMAGATLESLEILQVVRAAIGRFESTARLGNNELPLLRHLAEVALDDRPVCFPLERFF